MNFTLTPAAEKFIRRMIRFSSAPAGGFRLAVTAGGCSGLASEFDVEAAPRAGDAVHECAGIKFFLPAESRLLLDGVTIDFAETPMQSGLVFHDPKSANCGCKTTEGAAAGAHHH
ncbi:iron-sulfur cluster assembly accessory protein [Microbacteriaceae bacterium K1510]|nr:iron-sulfur cluster assembly accessory protein [Microbacteriaceae bacterium K1510]